MAINVTYNPISTVVGLGAVAGQGLGAAQKQQNDNAELARRQQLQHQLLAQVQQNLLQRSAMANQENQQSISTSLAYDRLNADNAQSQAALQQRASEQQASDLFQRQRLAQDQGQFDAQMNQRNQAVQTEQQAKKTKDAQVEKLIASTYTDQVEAAKARLLYQATGKLPEEILVPRSAQGVNNPTLDLQRHAAVLRDFLSNSRDDYGNLKPGITDQAYMTAQTQYMDLIQNLAQQKASPPAPAPQAQPQQSAAPAVAVPPQQATQIMSQIPQPATPGARLDDQSAAKTLTAVSQLLGKPTNDPVVIQKAQEILNRLGWTVGQ